MKRKVLLLMCVAFGVMCACDDDEEDIQNLPQEETPTAPEEEDKSETDTDVDTDSSTDVGEVVQLGDLTTFDFLWETITPDAFVDTIDVVPTDESHTLYEDYVENSEFNSLLKIVFADNTATVEGEIEGVTPIIEGAFVTIQSTVSKVEYEVSGTTTNGGLKIYSEKKFKLTLSGVNITNTQGSALNIQSKKRIFVHATEGSVNTFTDAPDYNTPETEDEKGCIFAEGQMIFSGSGRIDVCANYKHAICSDDYVTIRPETNINVISAPKDGIHTNGLITVVGGKLSITCSGDGIDCEEEGVNIHGGLVRVQTDGTATKGIKSAGKMNITGGTILALTSGDGEYDEEDVDVSASSCIKSDSALTISGGRLYLKSTGTGGKGISGDQTIDIKGGDIKVITTGKQYVYGSYDSSPKGIKADGDLTISGGCLMVRATGGEGSEGVESKANLSIEGGNVAIHTYDDAINAKSSIAISGGNIYCYATNNDGMDSNGTISISGGLIVTSGTTVPEEGVDCDNNQFKITGGVLLGIGGATSKPTSNVCTQNSLIWNSSSTANSRVTICKSDGSFVMSYVVPRSYNQGSTMLFTSDQLTTGASYVIYTDGNVTGGTTFNGLTLNGVFEGGTQNSTFAISSVLTTVGNSTGGGFPGGGPGGRW